MSPAAKTTTLDYGLGTSKINGLSATAGVDHPLTEQLDARLAHTFTVSTP
jgi:hypothetical protein